MTRNYYGWGLMLLSLATVMGTASSAIAAPLTGQCRAAKHSTGLYKERSSTSVLLTSLKMGDKVTLAEEMASDGLISVSTPAKGFVQTVNLRMCSGVMPSPKPDATPSPKPDTTTNTSSCRLVTQVRGLAIRTAPGGSDVVNGVGPNQKITLVTPFESKETSDGRTWIKISMPAEGWVSEGFTNGSKNVAACP